MSANKMMAMMSAGELLLWVMFALLFWRKGLNKRFPAMAAYLILHAATAPVFLALISGLPFVSLKVTHIVYFFFYWSVYILSSIILFLVCSEVFRSALEPLPGLQRLGSIAFRWVSLASLILSLSTVSFAHLSFKLIPEIAFASMRSVSVLELCLLAFLCVSMNALRLSVRDASFGISLGFGLMACNDLVSASLITRHTSLSAPLQFVYEGLFLAILLGWTVFFALPEEVRKPVMLPASSFIFRWNEIATALGHGETQVALYAANTSLLSDVQEVADRLFAPQAESNESEP
jgi:hypothetical protein